MEEFRAIALVSLVVITIITILIISGLTIINELRIKKDQYLGNDPLELGDQVIFTDDFNAIVAEFKKGEVIELDFWHLQLGDEEGREIWDVVKHIKK